MELICFSPDCGAWFGSRREHKGLRRKGATAVEGLHNYKAGAEISCGGCYCCFGWGWGVVVAGFGFGLVAGGFFVFFFFFFFFFFFAFPSTFFFGCGFGALGVFCGGRRERKSTRPHSRHRSNPHSRLFFFNDTATTEIYTLSLHDALPISATAALVGAGALWWLGLDLA